MSQSFNLYQLQKIDSRIDQLVHRMDEIAALIKDRTSINLLETELETADSKREKLLQEISDLDGDISRKKIKVNQSESSLYGGKVQNPKELQSLQAEIASINKNISEKESNLVELMQHFETSEKQVEILQQDLKNKIVEKEENNIQLLEEKNKLENEKLKLESERVVATSQVKHDFLIVYEDIRKKKRNIAVSVVEEDTCSACGVSLTPSEWQAARSTDQIVFCPSCSRILYAG
jgi:predicted  nucleic acid-binding Zn-ribbon protein